MNKSYPEAFEYLGWCSWEHFKKKIDSDKLVKATETIEESGLPIRWVLVDDGFPNSKGSGVEELCAQSQDLSLRGGNRCLRCAKRTR